VSATDEQALPATPSSPAAERTDGKAAFAATAPLSGVAGFLFLLEGLLRVLLSEVLAAMLIERIAAAFEAVRGPSPVRRARPSRFPPHRPSRSSRRSCPRPPAAPLPNALRSATAAAAHTVG